MGFFTQQSLAWATPPGCGISCQLYKSCLSPKMPITGNGGKGILVVAEAPGAEEDKCNKQLIGKAGQRLRTELLWHGIDLDRDCWKLNAVNCHPLDNRTPTYEEISACRPNVTRAIERLKPRLILLLGHSAMKSVVGDSNAEIAFGTGRGFPLLRGKVFPDRAYPGSWLCCTYHPSYIERSIGEPVVSVVWRNDLKRAFETLQQEQPSGSSADDLVCCHALTSTDEILALLRKLKESKRPFAEDYETTGLKPHASDQHVVSIGVCPAMNASYAFKLEGYDGTWKEIRQLWAEIMACRDQGKIAHNLPFEFEWTRTCFGVIPRGWIADTQVLAHLEDSRSGHSSLKVQTYLKFGEPDYSGDVQKYKGASMEQKKLRGCNALNGMMKAPIHDLLRYNALDALYTFRLWNFYRMQGVTASNGQPFEFYG